MNVNEVRSSVKTVCDKCCHSSVCQYKSKMMREVQEKVDEIKKDLIPLSPIKINVTCNSFKEEKFNDYGSGWNFR